VSSALTSSIAAVALQSCRWASGHSPAPVAGLALQFGKVSVGAHDVLRRAVERTDASSWPSGERSALL